MNSLKKENALGRFLSVAVERVERMDWLDPAAESLQQVLQPLRASRRLTGALSGTALGHPLHPLLVTVPIGSWTGALLLDLVGQRRSAQTLTGFGVLAAAPTAVTGLSDWLDTIDVDRRVGLVHAAANVSLVVLYGAGWLARRRGNHDLGLVLSLPAAGLLGLSGWLGGHLSYARGVGVDVTAWAPSRDWTEVAEESDVVAGSGQRRDLDGEPVLLTRTSDGTIVAYVDRCTHRGGPLSDGTLEDDCVTCPWHGSRFSLEDGAVLAGPATRPQPAYEVRTENGRVSVRRQAKL